MSFRMRVVAIVAILFLFFIWSGGVSDALIEKSAVLELSPGTAQVSALPQGDDFYELKRELLKGDGYKALDDRLFFILVPIGGRLEVRKGLSPHFDSWAAKFQLAEAKIWLNGKVSFENVPQSNSRISQIVFVEESPSLFERFKQKVLRRW
jgi:hypothetical protein